LKVTTKAESYHLELLIQGRSTEKVMMGLSGCSNLKRHGKRLQEFAKLWIMEDIASLQNSLNNRKK
jgi:hypothetical protein